jgi:hypothetical protein
MTVPLYINESKSDMRGIKSGWYAMDGDGSLVSGPFSSREKCVERDDHATHGYNAIQDILTANENRLNQQPIGAQGGVRRSNQAPQRTERHDRIHKIPDPQPGWNGDKPDA